MKRLTAAVAAIGLVATGAIVSVAGVASAAPENLAGLAVAPPKANGSDDEYGAKKAVVTWGDFPTIDPTFPAFAGYRVVADPNENFITQDSGSYGPGFALFNLGTVPVDGSRKVIAPDLSAGKNYYFAVYAVDGGGNVISPDGTPANTPIGYAQGKGFNLSIATSRSTVLSGNVIELSGTLTAANGSPLANETITIFRDPTPKSVEADVATSPVTTTAGGNWSFKTKPRINGRYWARYIPADGIGGWTKTVAIDVRAAISLNVRPDTTIRSGRELTFRGQVSGSPSLVAGSKICWQTTAGGSWGGGNCNATIKDDGSYSIRLTPGPDADGKYRVYSTDLAPYYVASKSKPVKITIR